MALNASEHDEGLLEPKRVAQLLKVSPKFLEKKRHEGGFIPYIKIGHLCRYTRAAVDDYIAAHSRSSTSAR
jgi:hypothetical protein